MHPPEELLSSSMQFDKLETVLAFNEKRESLNKQMSPNLMREPEIFDLK